MSADEDSVCIGVLVHCFLQTTGEIFLESGILDDRDPQGVVVSEHALSSALWNSLDLLNVADLEASVFALFAFDEESHQDGPLRVGVDASSGGTVEGRQEKWCAGRRVKIQWLPDVLAGGRGVLWRGVGHNEDVV